jgi:hypothetical protein
MKILLYLAIVIAMITQFIALTYIIYGFINHIYYINQTFTLLLTTCVSYIYLKYKNNSTWMS